VYERDSDAAHLDIYTGLLWKEVADVPVFGRRFDITANIQPNCGLAVRLTFRVDDEIEFAGVNPTVHFYQFTVVSFWILL